MNIIFFNINTIIYTILFNNSGYQKVRPIIIHANAYALEHDLKLYVYTY